MLTTGSFVIFMATCTCAVAQKVQTVDVTGKVLLPGGTAVQCQVRAKPRDGTGTFRAAPGGKVLDTSDKTGQYHLGIETDEPITLIVDDGGSEVEYPSLGYWDKNLKIDCELDPSVVQKKLNLLRTIGDASRQSRTWNQWIPEAQQGQWVSIKESNFNRVVVRVPSDKARLLAIDYLIHEKANTPSTFAWKMDERGNMELALPNEQTGQAEVYPSVVQLPRVILRGNPQWENAGGQDWSKFNVIPVLQLSPARPR
jgi:hypothetical protein